MTSLRPGDTAIIYWNAVWMGPAELIEVVDDTADMELWRVRFLDIEDPQEVWLDPDNCPQHLARLESGEYNG